MSGAGRLHVEESLRRIETLVASLDELQDPRARTMARDLVEALLDMQGLAFAKVAARLSATKEGANLFKQLAEDEQIKAILLLHGLHPDDAETRIRKAIEELRSRLTTQGAHIALIAVAEGIARLSLLAAGAGAAQMEMLRREIEQAVTDAAPDVDEVLIAVGASKMASALA